MIALALVFMLLAWMALITSLKDPAEIDLTTAWKLPSHIVGTGYKAAIAELAPSFF